MKLGVRAHDFGRMEPEALAAAIAEAGFEAVQLALPKAIAGIGALPDVTDALLERTRLAFEGSRVEISVLGCYVEPALPDKEARLREVQTFLLGLECAKKLGAPAVGTETTRFPHATGAEPLREAAYQNLKDSVLRMAERAEKLGVDIGIEPVAEHTLHSAAMTRRLLDEVNSPRLRVIFDPVNLLSTESDMQKQDDLFRDFLETLGAELAAVHIKDIVFENGEKVWRNIGGGAVRYEPVFRWIRANGRGLPLLREELMPDSARSDLAAMKWLAGL